MSSAETGKESEPPWEVMYPDGTLRRRAERPKAGDPALYVRKRGETKWEVIELPRRGK